MKSKNMITAILFGMASGLIIIVLLYLKILFRISGIVIILLELTILLTAMVGTVKYLMKRNSFLKYQESRMISFSVYLVTVIILFIQRYTQGWFSTKSISTILMGTIVIISIGWGISHLIGINNYKLENKE